MRDLQKLFYPSSITVIGASRNEHSVGGTLLSNIIRYGYSGKIYPVNPNAQTIANLPCFPDVTHIGAPVDLAVIIVPSQAVPDVLTLCGEAHIPHAVIISSGFGELGEDGKKKEADLVTIAQKYSISLIGPNCLGILNPSIHLNASFAGNNPTPGPIAFISQSGAICASMIDYANELRIGFSKFVSIGNKADICEYDLLEYFLTDTDTKVVCLYVESLHDAPRLLALSEKFSSSNPPKPIVILKAGQTDAGAKAAQSHTGSISGNAKAYAALFSQANITRVDTIEDLLTTAACFAYNSVPEGNRVAILTNAGGPGILATDTAVANGLMMAQYEENTHKELTAVVAPVGHSANPMDVLGDAPAPRYEKGLIALIGDTNVSSIVTILTPQSTTEVEETAKAITDLKQTTQKPITASFMGDATVQKGMMYLRDHAVATFRYPEDAVRSIAALTSYAVRRKEAAIALPECQKKPLDESIAGKIANHQQLVLTDASQLIASYGLRVPVSITINPIPTDTDQQALETIPSDLCAVKVISRQISHKTDVGGVALSVPKQHVMTSIASMKLTLSKTAPNATIEGFLVSEMADQLNAVELLVGFRREIGLGTVIVCGAGGILVELQGDVAMQFDPSTKTGWNHALKKLKIASIINGYRGKEAYSWDDLYTAIAAVTKLSRDYPSISELDINPLCIYPARTNKRPIALDVRISLE